MIPYSALLDASTSAVLALSPRVNIISFLAKNMPETEQEYHVEYPNYVQKFELATVHPKVYPEWTWNGQTRQFLPLAKDFITKELRQRSSLAMLKGVALSEVTTWINSARNPVASGLSMQETVYLKKQMQAQSFKDAGYPERHLLQYPYLLQYVEYSGLTPRAATDEILFKAKLADDLLL